MFVRHAFVTERFTTEAVFIDMLLKDASIDSCKVLKTYKFVIEAVLIETLVKEALVEICRVLVIFVKDAFIAERFTTEAVLIEALVKDAFVDH